MADLALIFKFRNVIKGSKFEAGVRVEGRVLLRQEAEDGGEFWMYGVNPGSIAEHGDTPENAYVAFRRYFQGILVDFANESSDINEFCTKVEAFLGDTDELEMLDWEKARLAQRSLGAKASEGFKKLLGVVEAGTPRVIECVPLKDGRVIPPTTPVVELTPATRNEVDEPQLELAA